MTSIFPVQCYGCARLDRSVVTSTGVVAAARCEAYPAGIPEDIGMFGADHRIALGGEKDGMLFTALDTAAGRDAFGWWQRTFDSGILVAAAGVVSSVQLTEALSILHELRQRLTGAARDELDGIIVDLLQAIPDTDAHMQGLHDQASHGRQRTGVLGNALGRLTGLRDKLDGADRDKLDEAIRMLQGLESGDVDDDDLLDPEPDEDEDEDEYEEEDDGPDMESASGDLTFTPYLDGDLTVDWDDGRLIFNQQEAREVAAAVNEFINAPILPAPEFPGWPEGLGSEQEAKDWINQWYQTPEWEARVATAREMTTGDGSFKVQRLNNGSTWVGDPESIEADDAAGYIQLDDPDQAREFARLLTQTADQAQAASVTTAAVTVRRPCLVAHLQGQHRQADHAGGNGPDLDFPAMSGREYDIEFGDVFDELKIAGPDVTVRVFGDGRAHLAADQDDGSVAVLTNSDLTADDFAELGDDLRSLSGGGGSGDILSAADLTFSREPGSDVEVSRSSDGTVLFHLSPREAQHTVRAFDAAAGALRALAALDDDAEQFDVDEVLTAAVSTMPAQLQAYWLTGEGAAKVRWCTPGSFRRARRLLLKEGVPAHMVDGTVANLYRKACGKNPGRHRGETVIDDGRRKLTDQAMGKKATRIDLDAHLPDEHNQADHGRRGGGLTGLSVKNAIGQLASAFHEDWRASRKQDDGSFEPRMKKTTDRSWVRKNGTDQVDIANTSFEDLPADWQRENREAARVVLSLMREHPDLDPDKPADRQLAGAWIHDAWLERNKWAEGGELDVPFVDLPKAEQDKDLDQLRVAQRLSNRRKAARSRRQGPTYQSGPATAAAALGESLESLPGELWHAVVHREGVSTGKRTWLPGSVEWREPPFAAHHEVISSAHGSNPVTVYIGNVTRVVRDGPAIHLWGDVDLGSDTGMEWARRLVNGYGGWPSFGPGSEAIEYDVVHAPAGPLEEPEQVLFRRYRMGETTFVSVPGQENTFVEALPALIDAMGAKNAVTAGAGDPSRSWFVEIPNLPPAEWFEEPESYPYGYAVTMLDDGHIFGLIAPHNEAHRTYARMGEKRTLASLGKVDFSRWARETIVEGGKRVLAGPLTMECMHAPKQGYGTLDRRNQYYEDSCSIFARVAVGNAKNGEGHWLSGAAMPGVTAEQVLKFLACGVSGDWQPHPNKPGWVELVAVLAVPAEGWPKSKTGVPSPVTRIRETEHGAIMVASAVPTRFEPSSPAVDASVVYGIAAAAGVTAESRVRAEVARIDALLGR